MSDPLEEYGLQEEYEYLFQERGERRARRVRPSQQARRFRREAALQDVADLDVLDGALRVTYRPGKLETGWLIESLQSFFQEKLISDLLYIVKGGKEANVYCCAAGAASDHPLLAVKVYRPHRLRKIRNDAQYREGRHVLDADGAAIVNDRRTFRALARKSKYGRQVQRVSWLAHEFETQRQLYEAGAAVPEPLAMAENAILMEFIGDADGAGPTLSQVTLTPVERRPLFQKVLQTVELLLAQGKIHGDLSAYNVLYFAGDVRVIDFPQVISAQGNQMSAELLLRDITRVCDYFGRQGLAVDATALADALWRSYVGPAAEQAPIDLAAFLSSGDGVR